MGVEDNQACSTRPLGKPVGPLGTLCISRSGLRAGANPHPQSARGARPERDLRHSRESPSASAPGSPPVTSQPPRAQRRPRPHTRAARERDQTPCDCAFRAPSRRRRCSRLAAGVTETGKHRHFPKGGWSWDAQAQRHRADGQGGAGAGSRARCDQRISRPPGAGPSLVPAAPPVGGVMSA